MIEGFGYREATAEKDREGQRSLGPDEEVLWIIQEQRDLGQEEESLWMIEEQRDECTVEEQWWRIEGQNDFVIQGETMVDDRGTELFGYPKRNNGGG